MASISFRKILPKPTQSDRHVRWADEVGDDGRGDTPAPDDRSELDEPAASKGLKPSTYRPYTPSKRREDIGPLLLKSPPGRVPDPRIWLRRKVIDNSYDSRDQRRLVLNNQAYGVRSYWVPRELREQHHQRHQRDWLIAQGYAVPVEEENEDDGGDDAEDNDEPPEGARSSSLAEASCSSSSQPALEVIEGVAPTIEEEASIAGDNPTGPSEPHLQKPPSSPRPAHATLPNLSALEEQPPPEEVETSSRKSLSVQSTSDSGVLPGRSVSSRSQAPARALTPVVRTRSPVQLVPLDSVPQRYHPGPAYAKLTRARQRAWRDLRGSPVFRRIPEPYSWRGAPTVYRYGWVSIYEFDNREDDVPMCTGLDDPRVQLRLFETKLVYLEDRLMEARGTHNKAVEMALKAYRLAMINGDASIWTILDQQAVDGNGEIIRLDAREFRLEWASTAGWLRKLIEDAEHAMDKLINKANTFPRMANYQDLALRAHFRCRVWTDRLDLQKMVTTGCQPSESPSEQTCRIWDCYGPAICREVMQKVRAFEVRPDLTPSMAHRTNFPPLDPNHFMGPSGLNIYERILAYTLRDCYDTMSYLGNQIAGGWSAGRSDPQPSTGTTTSEVGGSNSLTRKPARSDNTAVTPHESTGTLQPGNFDVTAGPQLLSAGQGLNLKARVSEPRKDSLYLGEREEDPPLVGGTFKNAKVILE